MRTLGIALIFWSEVLRAEPANFSVDYSHIKNAGNFLENTETQSLESNALSLKYSTGLVDNFSRTRVNFVQSRQDLSTYIVREKNGKENFLSSEFNGEEQSITLGQEIQLSSLSLGFDYGQVLNTSPLKWSSFATKIGYQFYEYGVNFSYRNSVRTLKRPLSYITNPETFQGEELSNKLRMKTHSFDYEQIFSEYLKTLLIAKHTEGNEDRPENNSLRSQVLVAPVDDIGISLAFERLKENTKRLPKSGSGFYSLDSYELGISYEMNYKYLFSLNYALVIEEESARGNNLSRKIGTDAFNFKTEMSRGRFFPYLSLNVQKSNNEETQNSFSGGMKWEI
jgi:hypothetical protein